MQSDHLVEKGIGLETKPQNGDAQHSIQRQDHFVLAERVMDSGQGECVLATVDFDDQPDVLPGSVQIDASAAHLAHDLPGRWGKAVITA